MGLIEHSFLIDIILRILITAYGASGVWNFIAYTPWWSKDDDFFSYNEFNYIFRLVTSLIFLTFWILQFKHPILVYVSLVEVVVLIIAYMILISEKWECIKRQKKMRKEMKRKKLELLDRPKTNLK